MIVTEISQQGDSFMSNVNKENKEFKFIKEQVIPKKRKKLRKWLLPFLMTIFMAIIFGLVAALTFCIAEPKLYKLLHKDETNPFVIHHNRLMQIGLGTKMILATQTLLTIQLTMTILIVRLMRLVKIQANQIMMDKQLRI